MGPNLRIKAAVKKGKRKATSSSNQVDVTRVRDFLSDEDFERYMEKFYVRMEKITALQCNEMVILYSNKKFLGQPM